MHLKNILWSILKVTTQTCLTPIK